MSHPGTCLARGATRNAGVSSRRTLHDREAAHGRGQDECQRSRRSPFILGLESSGRLTDVGFRCFLRFPRDSPGPFCRQGVFRAPRLGRLPAWRRAAANVPQAECPGRPARRAEVPDRPPRLSCCRPFSLRSGFAVSPRTRVDLFPLPSGRSTPEIRALLRDAFPRSARLSPGSATHDAAPTLSGVSPDLLAGEAPGHLQPAVVRT